MTRWFRIVVAVAIVVAAVATVFVAAEEHRQTRCLQAMANEQAWMAVNVVARDFDVPVSRETNKAAVANIDRRLASCLPGGR